VPSAWTCAWRLARVRLTLARYRGARLQALLAPAAGRDDAGASDEAARVVARVLSAARWVRGSRCLARAIAATEVLRAIGVAAQLRIGVRRAGHGPRAHAWVSVAGGAIGEDARLLAELEPLPAMDAKLHFD
jgi:hypothetical protein